jgi:hypothetical protein
MRWRVGFPPGPGNNEPWFNLGLMVQRRGSMAAFPGDHIYWAVAKFFLHDNVASQIVRPALVKLRPEPNWPFSAGARAPLTYGYPCRDYRILAPIQATPSALAFGPGKRRNAPRLV